MSKKPHKCTKKDIKAFCQALDSFWNIQCPHRMFLPRGERELEAVEVRSQLTNESFRRECIAGSIREAIRRSNERYKNLLCSIGEEIVHSNGTDEYVSQCIRDALSEEIVCQSYKELLDRVMFGDLPEEVLVYDPTA